MTEPTYKELRTALNVYALSKGNGPWETEARCRLQSLRDAKTTWVGTEENELRYVIINALKD